MFIHQTTIRVRYAETDQMGFVYYGQYASYLEVGRVEALRTLGIRYSSLEESGILMPVTDLHIRFKKPARYDEMLLIETRIETLPQSRIVFHYSMYNEAMELLNTAETELVFIRSSDNKPMRVPSIIIEALSKFFNHSDLPKPN